MSNEYISSSALYFQNVVESLALNVFKLYNEGIQKFCIGPAMDIEEYCAALGRGALVALAAKIRVAPSNVSAWKALRKPVPPKHAAAIEESTNGQITRQDLRPNDYREIWLDLKKAEDEAASPGEKKPAAAGCVATDPINPDA